MLLDHLYGVHIAEKKLFYIQGNEAQSFCWEEYGLRLHSSKNTTSLSDTCEVAITVLVGGHFKFPKGTTLASAVYAISVAKPLLKPLTLEIQHCVNLQTQIQANCLHFVRASLTPSTLPYEFTLLDGGQFHPRSRYGFITCNHFCLVSIGAEQDQQPHEGSDNKGSILTKPSPSLAVLDITSQDSKLKNKGKPKAYSDGSTTQGATPILPFMYTGLTYYEEKDGDWMVRFSVVKDLDALLKVIFKNSLLLFMLFVYYIVFKGGISTCRQK